MYNYQYSYLVTETDLRNLLNEAHCRLERTASFIVRYPFIPDCFAEVHVLQTRLVGLLPSQQIVAHTDPPIAGVRYHLPLQTNPGCWSFSAGVWQQLEVGKVYQVDPSEVHGAVNWGTEVRLHLMIDVDAVQA